MSSRKWTNYEKLVIKIFKGNNKHSKLKVGIIQGLIPNRSVEAIRKKLRG